MVKAANGSNAAVATTKSGENAAGITATMPEESTSTVRAKTLGKDEKRRLFDAYDTADGAVTKAETDLETARTARSTAVKAIFDAIGTKGPFLHKGETLTITERRPKNEPEGAPSYFMRGRNDRDVIEI